jgi:hypothetical protein
VLSPLFPTFAESTFGTISNATPAVAMTPYDAVLHCEMVLERSNSPYAHTFVTGHLKTLVAGHFPLLAAQQKIELSACSNVPAILFIGSLCVVKL